MAGSPEHEEFLCPHCGAVVEIGASFCRTCGASDESGWPTEDNHFIPEPSAGYADESDFDYDEFIAREFPAQARFAARFTPKRLLRTAMVWFVILAFLLLVLFQL